MLTGVHVLLTYSCLYECDHCFLFCSPRSEGTFTAKMLDDLMDEAAKIDSVDWIFFEGGESFLFFPLLLHGVKAARERGFKVGLVTNCYWATTAEDALLWLRPLHELGIDELSVSDDAFHFGREGESPAQKAFRAAEQLGLSAHVIEIEPPSVEMKNGGCKGEPIVGGDVKLRGRAVEKCAAGLPTRPREEFTECPYEDFDGLGRVHVDALGHVQLCQGLSIGNFLETPFSEVVANYRGQDHPVIDMLKNGGPAKLARAANVPDRFVDACHCCYASRRALVERYPKDLAPRQVYGFEQT